MKNIEKSVCLTDFGNFIREGRRRLDITQVEAAEMLGITQQYLSLVERGEREVGINDALEMCRVLGIDLRTFISMYM